MWIIASLCNLRAQCMLQAGDSGHTGPVPYVLHYWGVNNATRQSPQVTTQHDWQLAMKSQRGRCHCQLGLLLRTKGVEVRTKNQHAHWRPRGTFKSVLHCWRQMSDQLQYGSLVKSVPFIGVAVEFTDSVKRWLREFEAYIMFGAEEASMLILRLRESYLLRPRRYSKTLGTYAFVDVCRQIILNLAKTLTDLATGTDGP